MKKIYAIASTVTLFANIAVVRAAETLKIEQPTGEGAGIYASPTQVLTSAFRIIFVVAALAVLFMLIMGAFQWITSGGDKEAVAKARGRIVNALIGLVILALAFVIVRVVGGVVNINLLGGTIPSLNGN